MESHPKTDNLHNSLDVDGAGDFLSNFSGTLTDVSGILVGQVVGAVKSAHSAGGLPAWQDATFSRNFF
jgi:hypothetical protein